jgi:Tol biopolymer transport system component
VNADSQLGPYRITAPLGAGGMGEVYRATDSRLGRDVAIKVLPADVSADAERLRRFEQEARATGALNHPNILSIFDVGHHDGKPYLVAELLEGETLRERLGTSKLPMRKAVDYATQIADGLAAAHDRSIIHRDLKPENIFITKEGRVKILDFGLARVTTITNAETTGATDIPTTPVGTDPGIVVGTVGYMSPEQVRGRPADVRSDIFAFGTVLYEMVSGRRAFRGESAVETMNAILKEDPPEISTIDAGIPPGLTSIVTHCLEKQPEQRFQSAHDIAFSLRTLSNSTSSTTKAIAARGTGKRKWLLPLLVVGAFVLGGAATLLLRPHPTIGGLSYKRLTFRRGQAFNARFGPGGNILYGMFDGASVSLMAVLPPNTEGRAIGSTDCGLADVSKNGDMAILCDVHSAKPFTLVGTLAVMPMSGGSPRDVAEDVQDASWDPEGKTMAVVRTQPNGADQIEYPPGTVIFRSGGRADFIRFSRDGHSIAFVEHPQIASDGGHVAVIDLKGNKKDLTQNFSSARGVAWSPKSGEIYFTASEHGARRELYAVTLEGKSHLVESAPSSLGLEDIDDQGRLLLTQIDERTAIAFKGASDKQERDLSWLDWSVMRDLSADASQILFDETGEGAGDLGIAFMRRTDGSPAVHLTDGTASSFSEDGKWVVARTPDVNRRLILVPTGAGNPRPLTTDSTKYAWGALLPDGKRFVAQAFDDKNGYQLYVANLDGSNRRAISQPGLLAGAADLSPDGKWVATKLPRGKPFLVSIDGNQLVKSEGDEKAFVGFSTDSRYLYVANYRIPVKVTRVEIATGKREPLLTFTPTLMPPVGNLNHLLVAGDAKSYAYEFNEATSTLFMATPQ